MVKERKRRGMKLKNTILISMAVAILGPFTFNPELTTRAYIAGLGGSADCPPADTSLPTDAYVLLDAGHDTHSKKPFPNRMTRQTFEAAAIEYVEAVYRGRAPKNIVMLNSPDGESKNDVYQNQFQNLVGYHSHHKIHVPEEAFIFDNAENTTAGINTFSQMAQGQEIQHVEVYGTPNAKRASVLLCTRGIPATVRSVPKILETHQPKNVYTPYPLYHRLQDWRAAFSEFRKIITMPWVEQ